MKPVDKPVFLLLEFPPDEAADADPALAAAGPGGGTAALIFTLK